MPHLGRRSSRSAERELGGMEWGRLVGRPCRCEEESPQAYECPFFKATAGGGGGGRKKGDWQSGRATCHPNIHLVPRRQGAAILWETWGVCGPAGCSRQEAGAEGCRLLLLGEKPPLLGVLGHRAPLTTAGFPLSPTRPQPGALSPPCALPFMSLWIVNSNRYLQLVPQSGTHPEDGSCQPHVARDSQGKLDPSKGPEIPSPACLHPAAHPE